MEILFRQIGLGRGMSVYYNDVFTLKHKLYTVTTDG